MNKILISVSFALLCFFCAGSIQAQETMSSKYSVNFYGHIKSDFSYDEKGVTGDDYAQYVASEKTKEKDFRASARGTRFGFDINDKNNVSAKIEADFLGLSEANTGEAAGSTSDLRIRHAYVAAKFKKFEVLAGQTWHLLPLEFSGTNNEFALGYSGVLWFRAPQLRISYKKDDNWTFTAAAVRPTRKLTDSEGTASGLPQAQAQIQFKHGKAKFTLMGAYGKWRNTTTYSLGEVNLLDFGYNIPINSLLTLNGQIWTGQNLYDFLGGLGNMGYGKNEIKASGGFANINIKPAGKFYYNIAYGIDNPVNSKIAAAATAKTKNETILANVNYVIYEKVTASFEAAKQKTEYKLASGMDERENMHYQLSFKFPF